MVKFTGSVEESGMNFNDRLCLSCFETNKIGNVRCVLFLTNRPFNMFQPIHGN